MKFTLLVAAIIGVTLCTCKKPLKKYPVNGDLKAAFNYKVGTYWVYRDSISGGWDSFYVTRSDDTWNVNGDNSIEAIEINISEQNITTGATGTVKDWAFDYGGNTFCFSVSEEKIYTGSIEYCPLFIYPFGSTSAGLPGGGGTDYLSYKYTVGTYDSYTIGNTVFKNVQEAYQYADFSQTFANLPPYSYYDWFFLSADAGLIEIVINHPQDSELFVWQLQRWKIVK